MFCVNFPILGKGSVGRDVWKRCCRGWGRGRTGSLLKAKNPVMVCDEKFNEYGLITGLQQGNHWHVCGHKRAQ